MTLDFLFACLAFIFTMLDSAPLLVVQVATSTQNLISERDRLESALASVRQRLGEEETLLSQLAHDEQQASQQVQLLRDTLVPLQLDRDKAKFLAQRMAPQSMLSGRDGVDMPDEPDADIGDEEI